MCLTICKKLINGDILSTRYNLYEKANALNFKKLATEDIIIYKRLIGRSWKNQHGEGVILFAPIQDYFVYIIDKLYRQKGKTISQKFGISNCVSRIVINKGYHSWSTLQRAEDNRRHRQGQIYQGIISKGSIYFEGRDGDIVSDQIIIKQEIK